MNKRKLFISIPLYYSIFSLFIIFCMNYSFAEQIASAKEMNAPAIIKLNIEESVKFITVIMRGDVILSKLHGGVQY